METVVVVVGLVVVVVVVLLELVVVVRTVVVETVVVGTVVVVVVVVVVAVVVVAATRMGGGSGPVDRPAISTAGMIVDRADPAAGASSPAPTAPRTRVLARSALEHRPNAVPRRGPRAGKHPKERRLSALMPSGTSYPLLGGRCRNCARPGELGWPATRENIGSSGDGLSSLCRGEQGCGRSRRPGELVTNEDVLGSGCDGAAEVGLPSTEIGRSLLDQVRCELDDVDAALRRLDEGTYGHCEACGEPLEEQRLAALPAARFCAQHQNVVEGLI